MFGVAEPKFRAQFASCELSMIFESSTIEDRGFIAVGGELVAEVSIAFLLRIAPAFALA